MNYTKDGFHGAYRFLSNFALIPNETFKSVEHAYQASKFDHPEIRMEIHLSGYPGKAKQLARKHKHKIKSSFNDIKIGIMAKILSIKFTNEHYRWALLSTHGVELIEVNDWGDEFWGVAKDNNCGLNMLGRLLMLERDRVWAKEYQEFCIYKMQGGLISKHIIEALFKEHIKKKAEESFKVINTYNGWAH